MNATKKWLKKNDIVGIYKIVSPSNRVYIGQSWNIKNRWRLHKMNYPEHGCPFLKKSFDKYGVDSHLFSVIHRLPLDITQDVLNEYECLYIEMYKYSGHKMMNLKDGGSKGKAHPETKEKMSATMKDRIKNGINTCFPKGHIPWNAGTKGLMPKPWNTGLKGVTKCSDETKIKLSIANKGKQNSLGYKQTPEQIENRVKHLRGRKMPNHVNEILSKYRTPENAKKMGQMNKGKIRTEENKNKISKTLKDRTDNKGEFHNNAKITNNIVLEIRAKFKPMVYTSRMLAKEYNLSKTNILDIVNRKIWRHI